MRTVLIADRSLTIRRVVEHALGGRAARVVGAADVEELFRIAPSEAPDVLLCDAALPGLELAELRARLAALPGVGEIPLVLLTSALDPLDEDEASRLGASALLVKPFDVSRLGETIERALDRGPVPARPAYPPEEGRGDAERPDDEEARGIPEPPSFDSVWDEQRPIAPPRDAAEVALPPASESGEGDSEPLSLEDREPGFEAEDDEPLGPLALSGADLPPRSERVPLPGDEDFRLGATPLPEDEAPARPPRELDEDEVEQGIAALEPELRALVERVVREIAWEVVPDIVEAIARERASMLLPDSSSGDRKS